MTEGRVLIRALAALSLAFGGLALAGDPTPQEDLERALAIERGLVAVIASASPAFVLIGGGSGVIISADGYVVTNHHVAGSRPIGGRWRVKTPGGRIERAVMVGTDPQGDLSLLKIQAPPGRIFPRVLLGDSSAARVGDWVIALGNPFGFAKDARPTATLGLISARHRFRYNNGDAIQTDAAINSGNSGGPLLDLSGRLLGINASIATRHEVKINSGVGYAVSINQIKRFLPRLKLGGVVAHGRISGLRVRAAEGVVEVSGVLGGSPAGAAGFKTGDLIFALADERTPTVQRFYGIMSTYPAGALLRAVVLRGGAGRLLEVALSDAYRPDLNDRDAGYLGAAFAETPQGPMLIKLEPGSPAQGAGLREGDILLGVGATGGDLHLMHQKLRAGRAGQTFELRLRRGDRGLVAAPRLTRHPRWRRRQENPR